MGWGQGTNAKGRDVGYYVQAKCDEVGCAERIDRGLAYVCGNMHDGGEWGCGDYFCGKHLFMGGPTQLCKRCQAEVCARRCECGHRLDEHGSLLQEVLGCEGLDDDADACDCERFALDYVRYDAEVRA